MSAMVEQSGYLERPDWWKLALAPDAGCTGVYYYYYYYRCWCLCAWKEKRDRGHGDPHRSEGQVHKW